MKIKISKEGKSFLVEPLNRPGMYAIGRGRTMDEAMGVFLRNYQEELGIKEIHLDDAVTKTELRRRKRELAKR